MDIVRRYRVTWTYERGGSGMTWVQAYTAADAVTQVRLSHSGVSESVHYHVEPDPAGDVIVDELTEAVSRRLVDLLKSSPGVRR